MNGQYILPRSDTWRYFATYRISASCFVYIISTAYSLIFLTLEYSRNLKVRNLGLEQLASLQQASTQRRGSREEEREQE